uniref:Uncharacterized protein n=1 Tax=Lepeophtheirus salmonis TaxID=72036 RepID=A0A0K2UCY6_LEPSM
MDVFFYPFHPNTLLAGRLIQNIKFTANMFSKAKRRESRLFDKSIEEIIEKGSVFHILLLVDTLNTYRISDLGEEEMERMRKKESKFNIRRRLSYFKNVNSKAIVKKIVLKDKFLDKTKDILDYFYY